MSIPKEITYLEKLLQDKKVREFFRLLDVQESRRGLKRAGKTGVLDSWQMGEHLRAYVLRTEGKVEPGLDWCVLVETGMTLERDNDSDEGPVQTDTMRLHFRGRWYKIKLPKM
jgi:hypothetical protein